ncbi:D-alanyl-D-alanine carboxypeptidase [Proteiniclasticum sp.]|uniref:D-alanyl-D-alanine carboxypeptidase family protein n=1 Tax=Proteiniclasticum sp. TaxID=2053595 RepID=UPI00289A3EBA|nr:D-alanyl-D-alanine carboxypeptidase [Proteiniclasticum sp.]
MRKTLQRIPVIILLIIFMFPAISVKADMPEINGSSALSFDLETGELIYTKDIDKKMYPASITKLLTALVFSDHYSSKKTEYMVYPQEGKLEVAYSIYTNLKNIPVGTEISADNIMHALLLGSANDSAVVIAMNVAGSIKGFTDLMNAKAKEIGMMNSNFVTTTGIHHEDHYTTAYDLSFLLKAAYNDPWIMEVSKKQTYELKSKNQTLGTIENKNKHIGLFGNVMGKTGYTGEAGRCFAGVYERDGKVIGNVILNSDKTDNANVKVFEDTLKMIDSAFEEEKIIKLSKAEEVGVITVSYKPYKFIGPTREIDVPVKSVDTISYYGNDINLSETSLDLQYQDLSADEIKEETVVGKATVKERQITKSVNLVSTVDVQKKILKTHLLSYILIVLITLTIIVTFVVVTVNNKRKKAARRRRIESARRSKKFVDDHRSNRFR